jgi:DNA-binding NarL/FixJ family response regulator
MRTASLARGFGTLTAREHDVVQLIVAGKTNRQIAAQLAISHRTVENHVAAIFGKLGVNSRLQIALKYMSLRDLLN